MRTAILITTASLVLSLNSLAAERAVTAQATIKATLQEAWEAWTTEEGLQSFFAPNVHVEARVDGPFEILFDPSKPKGEQGSEGMRILAIQPMKMLAFTWNAPPHLPEARKQRTHVTIRFEAVDTTHTRVTLSHDGWGEGGQWDQAFTYFERAWSVFVFPALKKRFDKTE